MMTATEASDRLFYSLPKNESTEIKGNSTSLDLLEYIRENVIGKEKVFSGPFGLRKALYLDYTASGKSLRFIEDYIQNEVLPEYGNTHTTTSVTSLQTTLFRHEARDIVRNAVHASEHDAVIFVGSGSTGAIHKLIHALDLRTKPIVFVSPYEHHSNLLPWMEIGAKVIRVRSDTDGLIEKKHLESLLKKWGGCGHQLIGCFSAASNISGILVDVDSINVCLHKHGALAFWDYATAAPYVKIDMNPVSSGGNQEYMYKDAVFISTHKFVGGVSTPGVLIAKKKLFKNRVPESCGGGSVFFVRRTGHRYLQEAEMKEEGGTPAIVEAIRAGLVFQLKQSVTTRVILSREEQLFRQARDVWRDQRNLILLGNLDVPRLPIFSFLVYHPGSGRFLHHNYVSTLLNDLFGIQARGGCACAGPYAMDLLGLDEKTATEIEHLLAEDSRLDRTHLRRYREYSQREIIRPGFTRLNLPFFMDDDSLMFTLEAVKLVAEEGWKLLPQYMFNPETGEWRQKKFQVFKDRKWLGHISYNTGEMSYRVPPPVVKGPLPDSYQDCLQKARDLFQQAVKTRYQLADHTLMFDEQSKQYRWFLLPSEAADCLHGNTTQNESGLPFCPPSLRKQIGLPVFVENSLEDQESVEEFVKRVETFEHRDAKSYLTEINCSAENDDQEPFSVGFEKKLNSGFENPEDGHLEENKCKIGLKDDKSHMSFLPEKVTSARSLDKTENGSEREDLCICRCENECDSQGGKSDTKYPYQPQPSASVLCKMTENSGIEHGKQNCVNVHDTETNTDPVVIATSRKQVSSVLDPTDNDNVKSVQNIKTDLAVTAQDDKSVESNSTDHETRKRPGDSDFISETELQVKRLKDQVDTENVTSQKNYEDKKKQKTKWFSPPKAIFTPFLKAMEEFGMFRDRDRVLVCLSGGKDSLSLLHTVRQYQFYCKKKGINFDFGALTVDPQTPAYDPSPLKDYLASLGVPYFYESQCILDQASNLPYECASICSFCSRMKRGRIYACARREGYNVLALGQHLDDLCESFLMSLFHNGILRTMKAHYTVEEGDLRVTRPLVYVREKDLRSFAEKNKLPVIAENCPACFEAPKERHRTKQLLASQEIMFPRIFNSMMSAIRPIMAINKTGVKMADILQAAEDQTLDDIDI